MRSWVYQWARPRLTSRRHTSECYGSSSSSSGGGGGGSSSGSTLTFPRWQQQQQHHLASPFLCLPWYHSSSSSTTTWPHPSYAYPGTTLCSRLAAHLHMQPKSPNLFIAESWLSSGIQTSTQITRRRPKGDSRTSVLPTTASCQVQRMSQCSSWRRGAGVVWPLPKPECSSCAVGNKRGTQSWEEEEDRMTGDHGSLLGATAILRVPGRREAYQTARSKV
jgi:hypothetical protein